MSTVDYLVWSNNVLLLVRLFIFQPIRIQKKELTNYSLESIQNMTNCWILSQFISLPLYSFPKSDISAVYIICIGCTNWTFLHSFGTLYALIFCSDEDYALFWCYLGQICLKLYANLASFFFKYAETTPSNCAMGQHLH